MPGLPFRRFRVEDTSMQPALRPGDHLLVFTWPRRLRPGDIVVFRDPEAERSTFLIKRAVAVHPGGDLEVCGDSPNVSRDSRHFGLVARRLLIGRAVYRYLPAERRGRL